jgi:hypothetical protein
VSRRTNLTLLAVLASAFASGVASLWVGIGNAGLVTWLHGAVGLAVLALVPRKWPVARRGLSRMRGDREVALLTAAVAIGALAAGVAHVAGVRSAGPLTALGLHIALALALLPLVAFHVVRRPQRPRRGDLTRAGFLRLAGLAVLGVAAKSLLEGGPAASRAATGSRRTHFPPATSWIDDSPPDIDPALWETRLAGLPRQTVRCALDCTSGWYAVNEWAGVPVSTLLGRLPAGTRSVVVRSATGYSRRFAPSELEGLLLATHMDGSPIGVGNGAPARLVAPGRRGFWWVKWVDAIEPSSRPTWWQLPFPID